LSSAQLHSVEAFHEHASFEGVRGGSSVDPGKERSRDRDRTGARVTWAHREIQSFAQLYHVSWPDAADANNRFEGVGLGVGFRGTPIISYAPGGVHWILPWEAGMNIESAEDTSSNPSGGSFDPFEYAVQLGVGIDWRGFRPTVGMAYSRIVGTYHPDGGSSSDDDQQIRAGSLGFYGELEYRPPNSNVYGKLRYQRHEYDALAIGVGIRF
jgi:hypothetical protein